MRRIQHLPRRRRWIGARSFQFLKKIGKTARFLPMPVDSECLQKVGMRSAEPVETGSAPFVKIRNERIVPSQSSLFRLFDGLAEVIVEGGDVQAADGIGVAIGEGVVEQRDDVGVVIDALLDILVHLDAGRLILLD